MEESIKPVGSQSQNSIGENLPASVSPPALPANTFTKVDNNLTGIGFFTASSKRSRKAIEKTTIVVDQGIEHRISILPSAKYGLPITADQDYWLALMQLVEERRRQEGKLTNPFAFTTAELRHILGQVNSGKNYQAVNEWLSVMNSTAIEGGSYNAARKTWYNEKTHAVDRVITVGKELPNGSIADKNHIWFSQWQLDNINAGNLIAIELSTYLQLNNNIAKNLVPHLQEWLFASQRDGKFEKQYEDVCQLLGIRTYRYRSQIEEQLGPSLNELTSYGYLSKWTVEPMANRKHYKLVLRHGSKYHSDRQSRLEKKSRVETIALNDGEAARRRPRQRRLNLTPQPTTEPQPSVIIDYRIAAELGKRGIGEADARQILASLPPGQPVLDQLEWGDLQIEQSRGKITNPPGFYISLLQRNVPVPPTFESSQARKKRQEAESAQTEALQQQRQTAEAAEEEQRQKLDRQITALPEPDRQLLLEQAKAELLASYPGMAAFFKTNPDNAINDGAVRVRMRGLIGQGWKPHQTINQPSGQAAALQAFSAQPALAEAISPQQTVAVQPQSEASHEPAGDIPFDLRAMLSRQLLPAPKEPAPAQTVPEAATGPQQK